MVISESPEKLPLEPRVKHTSENHPSPKKGGLIISNSERRLEIPMATIDDERKVQGAIRIPQGEGLLGNTYTTPQRPNILVPESVRAVVQGTETKVITSGCNSRPVAPIDIVPVSISADDHLLHEQLQVTNGIVPTRGYAALRQSPTLAITGESMGIMNTAVLLDSSEQLSRKGLLKDVFLNFLPWCRGIRPFIYYILGINCQDYRFIRSGNIQDIDRAIFYLHRAVRSIPSHHTSLPRWCNNLGNPHFYRSEHTRELQLSMYLNALGISYFSRFIRAGNLQDVEHAISHHQKAVEYTPAGHADLPNRFSNLGNSYLNHFIHTGDLQDADHAMSYHQKAMEYTPAGHADLPSIFNDIGNSYFYRFLHTGDLQDIDNALFHHQRAVESTPFGHAHLPFRFSSLGNSYLYRFRHTGYLQDVDHAMSYHQKAVESTSIGHADLAGWLNNLGNSYLYRFNHTGNFQDIDHAISHHQRAVESISFNQADLPARLSNLGNSYNTRFLHTGDLQDIDNALSHLQRAVESTSSGHSHLPARLSDLGNSYLSRFTHTSDLQDMDYGMSHLQRAVEFTPSDHAELPARLSSLGQSYSDRFIYTGDLQDIDYAISHHQRAVESTPSVHAELPCRFSRLGNSYLYRFRHTGDFQDINHAMFYHQKAVESAPSHNANFPHLLHSLANSYSDHFQHTGDLQDIDHAISYHQRAVESTPSGHVNLPLWFINLGHSHACRFKSTNSLSDIQQTITSYRQGAQTNGAPTRRLIAAKNAAMHSAAHEDSHCLTDFALAISLLSEVAGLGQTIHRRYANLHGHSGFVQFAVTIALKYNRSDLALEWLEHGRCLVWNQLNQLHTPIENLYVRSPSLANHFVMVAGALESYGTRSSSILSSDSTLTEHIHVQNLARNHTALAAQYKQLLKKIQGLPDFHNFLTAPSATHLFSSLPSDGPVIIFNIDKTQCDALALIAGIDKPLHISLENFSLIEAEKLWSKLQFNLSKQREREDIDRAGHPCAFTDLHFMFVLKELWEKVVHPVLKVLGYSSCSNPSDRHRIWWCPTGPLAFLPLHAAGIYDSAYQAGQCVSDFVVSSYTPTVTSLNQKFNTSSISSSCTGLILISQPNTPGLSPIPSTRKEAHNIKTLIDGSGTDVLLLEGAEATTDKVKTEMKAYNWVHFACHGIQDVDNPLKSGVHLHNGRLELLEIMQQQIPNPGLAFLSACQTSKGDFKLSEEVVHLAAGMLAAGYHGVVGTMWNISDMHGPEFATEFYKYLLTEKRSKGLDSTQAAYALDYAVRKVRESLGNSDAAFLTWVPYVHFGY